MCLIYSIRKLILFPEQFYVSMSMRFHSVLLFIVGGHRAILVVVLKELVRDDATHHTLQRVSQIDVDLRRGRE